MNYKAKTQSPCYWFQSTRQTPPDKLEPVQSGLKGMALCQLLADPLGETSAMAKLFEISPETASTEASSLDETSPKALLKKRT